MTIRAIIAPLLIFFFAFGVLFAAVQVQAAPALTSEQETTLRQFGIDPNAGNAAEILAMLSGGCQTIPYRTLESLKIGASIQITPVTAPAGASGFRVGIDPVLACRLTKFIEFAQQKGCTVQISSAYRSAQQQENMCGDGRSGCAAAGRSCHQYGLAVDVSAKCDAWLRQTAPQFQLHYPYSGAHIQCLEHRVAACSPSTPPCNGSIGITPDLSRIPNMGAPSSGFADSIRQAFGMPQQPALMPQQPVQQQPLPSAQNPLSAFQPQTNIDTSSPTPSGSQPGVAPDTTRPTSPSTNVTPKSIADLLRDIEKESAAPATSTAPAQSTSTVKVYINPKDVAYSGVSTSVTEATSSSGFAYAPATVPVTQTFVSPDMMFEEEIRPQSNVQSILARLKAILEIMMAYLRPFGRPASGDSEHAHE